MAGATLKLVGQRACPAALGVIGKGYAPTRLGKNGGSCSSQRSDVCGLQMTVDDAHPLKSRAMKPGADCRIQRGGRVWV